MHEVQEDRTLIKWNVSAWLWRSSHGKGDLMGMLRCKICQEKVCKDNLNIKETWKHLVTHFWLVHDDRLDELRKWNKHD